MNFDFVIGNPPYQSPNKAGIKSNSLWDKITVKCFGLVKQNGTMAMIHPGSWRMLTDRSPTYRKKVKSIYLNNEVIYAEFNSLQQGMETFNVGTDYDVMIVKKNNNPKPVKVKTQSETVSIDFRDFDIIPTDGISDYQKLLPKNDEKINVLWRRSDYGRDKHWVSKEKTEEYKYPVVYSQPKGETLKLLYSNTNTNGHFGIQKLILSRAGYSSLLDEKGEYGMSEYSFGIIDDINNLKKIQKAVFSKKFIDFMSKITGSGDKNRPFDNRGTGIKFLKTFRKDFWKEFL